MKYQKIKLKGNKQKGFTLIELLMVVVILGILAYVATSAFSGSPNAANATAIRSGATEIAKGVGYIHANIGNGITTVKNPLTGGTNSKATMLDVLMVGNGAVDDKYLARFDALEMRPLESEFRVNTRGSKDRKGVYSLLSYKVEVDNATATDACPKGKVCVSFDNVPDAVRDEIFTRYGLRAVADAAIGGDEGKATVGVEVMSDKQPLPVAFKTNGDGTNLIKFALIP